MSSQVTRAVDALFPEDKSAETGNIKFLLGTNRKVTGAQLMDQLGRADAQIKNGVAEPTKHLDGELAVKKIA